MNENISGANSSANKISKAGTTCESKDANIQYSSIRQDEDDEPLIEDIKDESKCLRFYNILVTLTIEPVMFSFMFAYVMNAICLSNMIMDKGCLYYFNFSYEICQNITTDNTYSDEKTKVETLATNYTLYLNLLSLVGAFFMLFIAPWSDKYGRKLPLILAMFGSVLTNCGFVLCVIYFESGLEYILLSRLPSEICGGFICVLTIIYSHASEVTTDKTRTLKYTAIEIALGFGLAGGGLAAGFLYRYYGYLHVYATVTGLNIFCLLWCIFVVEETTGLDVNMTWIQKAKDFFICHSFKSGITATFKRREGNTRKILLLLTLSMCIAVLNYETLGSFGYLYVHHIFSWDPTDYSIVNTSSQILQFGLSLIAVSILIKVYKTSDYVIGFIGAFSMMSRNFIMAFSKYEYIYYIALVTGLCGSLATLAVRSGMSKLVDKEELGKVFSFLATCQAILPVLGNAALTIIFKKTIAIFPSIAYIVMALVLLIPLGTFIYAQQNSKKGYRVLSVTADDP